MILNNKKIKFIDNHSHIIPNVDDGSGSIEESIEMARQASEQGIEIIYATPHIKIDKYIDNYCYYIDENFVKLKKAIADRKINIILKQGYELYATHTILYNPNLSRFCLEHTDYLLVEVNPNSELRWLVDFAHELNYQGIKMILAHPERYEQLFKASWLIEMLGDYNVLYQINTGSILGCYGRKAYQRVKKLIKKRYVHLIGTDAHYAGYLGIDISKAYNILCRWIDHNYAQDIVYNNANKIINGEGI